MTRKTMLYSTPIIRKDDTLTVEVHRTIGTCVGGISFRVEHKEVGFRAEKFDTYCDIPTLKKIIAALQLVVTEYTVEVDNEKMEDLL